MFLCWKCLVGDRQCMMHKTQLTSERHEEEPRACPSTMKEHHINPAILGSMAKRKIHTILSSQFKKA